MAFPAVGKWATYKADTFPVSPATTWTWTRLHADKTGTFPTIFESATGRLFVFYCVPNGANYDLQVTYCNDGGATWSTGVVVAATVLEGVVGAIEYPTGRIVVNYWKSYSGTDTPYSSFSDDGGVTWTAQYRVIE